MRRFTVLMIAYGLASCSLSAESLVKNATTFNAGWDAALAPVSCKNLHYVKPYWVITGTIVENGVLYVDEPISDPAVNEAVSRKFANHIGPGC